MLSRRRGPSVLLGLVGGVIAVRGAWGYLTSTQQPGPRIGNLFEIVLVAHLLAGAAILAIAAYGSRTRRPALPAAALAGLAGGGVALGLDVFGRFPNTQLALAILFGLALVAALPVGLLVHWRTGD